MIEAMFFAVLSGLAIAHKMERYENKKERT